MMGALTSRSVFLNNVMAAVKDPNIRVIRICGMGGIGKTTIAKPVEQRARAEHLFHEIAMVEVNQNPDPTILQLHIAKRLCKPLILLIPEDLEEAGIPGEKSLCKILLTSRSDLVWKDMALEPEFNPHPENDRMMAEELGMMAEELVKECGGLPISSTAIAGAVAYKSKQSWTDALRKLQKSDFKGSDVPIEDLARYGMALGCFSDPDKLYETRNEAYSYADTRIQTYCYAVTSQGVFKFMTLYGILLCQFHLMICLS